MIKQEDIYKIGVVGKAHGVKGEVSMHFTDDVFDRVDADYIILEADGLMVPFFFEEYRFRSDETIIMKLEDVDTQERARELTGCPVYFPRCLADDDDELSLSSLVGFDIIEASTARRVGTVAAIDDQTANTLFCLDDGKLVPASDDLIADIDTAGRRIVMHLPPGLLELQG